jgi:hypothetical protein
LEKAATLGVASSEATDGADPMEDERDERELHVTLESSSAKALGVHKECCISDNGMMPTWLEGVGGFAIGMGLARTGCT